MCEKKVLAMPTAHEYARSIGTSAEREAEQQSGKVVHTGPATILLIVRVVGGDMSMQRRWVSCNS